MRSVRKVHAGQDSTSDDRRSGRHGSQLAKDLPQSIGYCAVAADIPDPPGPRLKLTFELESSSRSHHHLHKHNLFSSYHYYQRA